MTATTITIKRKDLGILLDICLVLLGGGRLDKVTRLQNLTQVLRIQREIGEGLPRAGEAQQCKP